MRKRGSVSPIGSRVLARGLLVAAPAAVARYVDVGRPEGQSIHTIGVGVCRAARLAAHDRTHLPPQALVERGGDADAHREGGGVDVDIGAVDELHSRKAVHSLIPPVVARHPEPLDWLGCVAQQLALLSRGQRLDQGADPRRTALAGVAPSRGLMRAVTRSDALAVGHGRRAAQQQQGGAGRHHCRPPSAAIFFDPKVTSPKLDVRSGEPSAGDQLELSAAPSRPCSKAGAGGPVSRGMAAGLAS